MPEFENSATEPFTRDSSGLAAAERAADPDLVPCVGKTEAVAAEYVHAVCLADGAYDAASLTETFSVRMMTFFKVRVVPLRPRPRRP